MKRIKFSSLFIASLLLFVFFNNLRAEERSLAQVNYQINFWYKEAMGFYQYGQYAEAKNKLNKIIKTLASNPPAVIWRSSHKMEPPQETFYKMFKQTEEQIEWKKAQQKQARQQELQRKEEELARQKEEKQKQLAEEKAKQEQERKAKEEKKAQVEAERKARETKLKAQKQKETQEKQLKLEAERKAREEELARQKEEKQKQLAEEKAKQEQERKAKEEKKAQVEAERKAGEVKPKAKEEKLAKQKEERSKQQQELKAKQEQERKVKQEELAREREKLELKVNEMKRASVQEKAMTEAMLKKHRHDQAKIKDIEGLWKRARRLYAQGMYGEAIQDFQKIIELEGNPRIKYTPEAKQYIEKAKNNMAKKQDVTLAKKIELSEKEMLNQAMKLQVPPYIEPPKHTEPKEPSFLIEPPAIRKKLKASKITMDFDKVGLKSALAFLAQESGINFVASGKILELKPIVSASFKDTALDEVIKYITKNLGLVYRVDKEVVWIAHPDEIANEAMETRVYYLNKGGGLFTEFSPMSSGTTETSLGGSSAQINKIYTIEDTLKAVIPWPADSKLSYDKRLNALLVRNTPQNLQMLEDILYTLDVEPLQVLIEARFIEVDVTDTKELGMDWNIAQGDWQLKDRNGTFKKGLGKNTGVDFTAFTRATEGLNLNYIGMLTNSQFKAVLHALAESKKVKTLSSPRITTLNNQLATIKVVDEWIYPTRYEFEILQVPGQLPSATPTYEYKNVPKDFLRRDVGLILKVIPAVGADKKTISLSLIPEVSEGTVDGFTYTGGVTLPKFTSRNLSTSVVVTSGDTVVLGGMVKENRTKTLTKVPFFGDMPFVGGLFKKNTDSIERKNLLIFVTAKVLSSSGEEVIVAQK